MAQPDDHSFSRTREEAERLLRALDNQPPSPSSGTVSPATAGGAGAQPIQPTGGRSVPMGWLVVAALAFGALLSALGMALFLKTPQNPQPNAGNPSPSPSPAPGTKSVGELPAPPIADPVPLSPRAPRVVADKASNLNLQATPANEQGAWGPASAYKFNRLPDSTYPDSCAFSQTDSAGQTVLNRSSVEYWACRDEGGNSSEGFSVVWVDGKRTKYTFGPGGSGLIVGTNGAVSPITWRNDTRNGTNVIIIAHETGSTSWIPGRVN